MSTADRRALTKAGAVADVSGVFLDASGRVVGHEQTARMICMTAEQLADVEDVLAIPYGVSKAPAVLAAVRSGSGHQLGDPRHHGQDPARRLGGQRLPAQRGLVVSTAGARGHTETVDVPVTRWKHSVTTMDP